MDRQYRVTIIKSVESELSVAVYASSPAEAERMARDMTPEWDARSWTVVNREISVSAEQESAA